MNMENKIFRAIDTILWNDWDPIGVNDICICRDEYRSYVPAIYIMKMEGSDCETIASHLLEIAREEMEITLTIESCRRVAEKIIAA
jgi:hypothetical protein